MRGFGRRILRQPRLAQTLDLLVPKFKIALIAVLIGEDCFVPLPRRDRLGSTGNGREVNPRCTEMVGSIMSLRSVLSRARMRSSSAPASLEYPTTSEARIAAIFRLSLMARPSAAGEISTEARPEALLIHVKPGAGTSAATGLSTP